MNHVSDETRGNMECMESIDFNKFELAIQKELAGTPRYLIVEGYLSCCDFQIVSKYFDWIIFLDTTDNEVAKQRRWNRSKKKNDFEQFSQHFDSHIWKYYLKYRTLQLENIIKSGKPFACINVDEKTALEVQNLVDQFLLMDTLPNQPPEWYQQNE